MKISSKGIWSDFYYCLKAFISPYLRK